MIGPKERDNPKEMAMGDGKEIINGYLLHPKKDKPLEMLAVTTCFISYVQITKVDG
jgi:hypothetical protein